MGNNGTGSDQVKCLWQQGSVYCLGFTEERGFPLTAGLRFASEKLNLKIDSLGLLRLTEAATEFLLGFSPPLNYTQPLNQ